ncbi:hypothetical protein SEA_COMRADE_193 [Streptomyces phage Comrade]|uniref:Uncharacterized protein n=3 Tax=Gilsonvirus comrade TaxID=2846395 RepID=A0A345ME94_9CAUD|nr:hypothetical protein HWB84_gp085 [Streptomyces phage Comrade]AXH68875.1 hypothetical protein SEA_SPARKLEGODDESS_196 [Streptomyces phage SparkleGoddess]AXQ63430.1 hypothetical protein SEA_COMRADE_193 [Streptomyces phage Comrade]QQO39849.1 hypothetical protein SEA_BELFORT_196 [Streptomyces phage Belfort]UTN92418.1 hypothetical protein SEA_STIGMA_194 [Streptomyces phage Stigma]
MREICEELAHWFLVHDYKWKFDYGHGNPDADDIEAVVNRAMQLLSVEDTDTRLEVGRLIFMKNAELGLVDIFVHAGTIGENDEDSNV